MRIRSSAFPAAAALAAAVLVASCGRDRPFTVTTKDGVRIVHNLRPAATDTGIRLEFVRQIGRLEGGSPEEMFTSPLHAAKDEAGNLYVLDNREGCIRKFDPDGRFLLRFGRLGQGPGELQYPMQIGIAGRDRLIVSGLDSSFRIFDLEGGYVGLFQRERYAATITKGLASGQIVCSGISPSRDNAPGTALLNVIDLEGRLVRSFGKPLLLSTARDSWRANFLALAVDAQDCIYAAFSSQNRIEKYSADGRLLLAVSRALPYPVEHTPVKEQMEIGGAVREIDALKTTPVSRGIGVDAGGRIWVLSFHHQPPANIDPDAFVPGDFLAFEVYAPDGILIARVPLPESLRSFDNFVMSGDTLLFLDPRGECCVFEFRVVED